MRRFEIPGFPNFGELISLPDIAELLVQPMYWKIDADLFRKIGTEDQRALLDQAPLTHRRRYVSVSVKVNLFYPSDKYSPAGEFQGRDRPWHRDGHVNLFHQRPDIHHLLLSACEVLTEFNEIASEIDVPDDYSVLTWLEDANSGRFPLRGVRMPHSRFVTFSDHLHRPTDTRATHHQFRYSFRIIESDESVPAPWPNCMQTAQHLLPHHTEDHSCYRVNLERPLGGGRVVLHLPDDPFRAIGPDR